MTAKNKVSPAFLGRGYFQFKDKQRQKAKQGRKTLGAAQTRLLFEKSKAKNFYTKPHIYAVLDGYGYHGVAGFCVANVSDPITAQDRADGAEREEDLGRRPNPLAF
ncbi:MAG: hypothetical protein PHG19_03940 [Anaerotignum sp.]|nr:hypothetical protein [Anaerotignum sp.]